MAATADGVVVGVSSGHAGRDGAVYRFDGTAFTRSEGLPERMNGACDLLSATFGRFTIAGVQEWT